MLWCRRLGKEERKIIPVRKTTEIALPSHYLHLCHSWCAEHLICIPSLLKCVTQNRPMPEKWWWKSWMLGLSSPLWSCLPVSGQWTEQTVSLGPGAETLSQRWWSIQVLWASPLKWQGSTADEVTVSCWRPGPGLCWVSGKLGEGRELFSW